MDSLGFVDQTNANDDGPRVFVHSESDTVLLYRRALDKTVSPADALSTEVHLNSNGFISRSLEDSILDPA